MKKTSAAMNKMQVGLCCCCMLSCMPISDHFFLPEKRLPAA